MSSDDAKKWRDYLSATGATSYAEFSTVIDLPDDHWRWGTLGEANQLKLRAQRAAELELYTYFLLESENIQSGLHMGTVGHLLTDQATAQRVFQWYSDQITALTAQMVNMAIRNSPPSSLGSPSVKMEPTLPSEKKTKNSLSTSFTEKIQLERFKSARDSVPVFTRVYDTAIVFSICCNEYPSLHHAARDFDLH